MTSLKDRVEGPIGFQLLPSPKGLGRSRALAIVGDHVGGTASRGGGQQQAVWWRADQAFAGAALVVEGSKRVDARFGRGSQMAGIWDASTSKIKVGPLVWRVQRDGTLAATELPFDGFVTAHAMHADDRSVVGSGEPRVKKGERALERALMWRDEALTVLPAPRRGGRSRAGGGR
jgi:hypothetical protein